MKKEVFLEILQNSQENICARVSLLINFQALAATLLKRESGTGVFLVNFAKILRTPLDDCFKYL